VIVDEFSRYSWVFFMEAKGEAFTLARVLILWLQTEFPKNAIRVICNDNGTQFKNTHFETFCASLGLEHDFSSPYVPKLGVVMDHDSNVS
jgi:transposase InsO family protein